MSARRDRLLLLSLCLLALFLLLLRGLLSSPSGGKRVVVSQDGAAVREYALSEDRTELITAPGGGSNTLHIQGGSAWISGASCPDKLCEHSGKISRPGELIVCLPNRLIIQIAE